MSTVLDLAGWVGGVLGIVAYALVSRGRVAPDSAVFQGSNIVGAALLAAAALRHGALPSAFMNLAWIGFGCQALVVASRRTRTSYAPPTMTGLDGLDELDGDLDGDLDGAGVR